VLQDRADLDLRGVPAHQLVRRVPLPGRVEPDQQVPAGVAEAALLRGLGAHVAVIEDNDLVAQQVGLDVGDFVWTGGDCHIYDNHVEQVTEQLQAALNSRVVIEQAKGAMAQIHGGTPDEAFVRIRDFCRRNGLRLSEVALAITADPGRFPELTTP